MELKRSSSVAKAAATSAHPRKNLWRPEEDLILKKYVEIHGEGNWTTVSQRSGLMRGGKSCRLRWKNYLRPNIKHGEMSQEEQDLIIRMHKLLGNRWSLIAGRLPGRTDNEAKNYWNTHLNKMISCCPTPAAAAGAKRKSSTTSSMTDYSNHDGDQHMMITRKKKTKIMSPNYKPTLTTTATTTSTHPIISAATTDQSPKDTSTDYQEEPNGLIATKEEDYSNSSSNYMKTIANPCIWLGNTSTAEDQSFNNNYYDHHHIESPSSMGVQCQYYYVPTDLNAAFVLDDEPFTAYMDCFLNLF